jgi:hypothetical protein
MIDQLEVVLANAPSEERLALDALAQLFGRIGRMYKTGKGTWKFTPILGEKSTGPTNKMVCGAMRAFETEIDEHGNHRKVRSGRKNRSRAR